MARWLELVCDGKDDTVTGLLEQLGRPRKVDEPGDWTAALAAEGHAIQADLKDDDTVADGLAQLAGMRGMQAFEAPQGPPSGSARCTAMLRGFGERAGAHGYRLIQLDNRDDAWHVVLVKAPFADEFLNSVRLSGSASSHPCRHLHEAKLSKRDGQAYQD